MTVSELLHSLWELDGNLEVAILDGHNGGGQPRTLNLGPHLEERDGNGDDRDTSDLCDIEASSWVVLGYGCY